MGSKHVIVLSFKRDGFNELSIFVDLQVDCWHLFPALYKVEGLLHPLVHFSLIMNGLAHLLNKLSQLILSLLWLPIDAPEETLFRLLSYSVNHLTILGRSQSLSEISAPTELISQNLLHYLQSLLIPALLVNYGAGHVVHF